jgi:hypothetical protein
MQSGIIISTDLMKGWARLGWRYRLDALHLFYASHGTLVQPLLFLLGSEPPLMLRRKQRRRRLFGRRHWVRINRRFFWNVITHVRNQQPITPTAGARTSTTRTRTSPPAGIRAHIARANDSRVYVATWGSICGEGTAGYCVRGSASDSVAKFICLVTTIGGLRGGGIKLRCLVLALFAWTTHVWSRNESRRLRLLTGNQREVRNGAYSPA